MVQKTLDGIRKLFSRGIWQNFIGLARESFMTHATKHFTCSPNKENVLLQNISLEL